MEKKKLNHYDVFEVIDRFEINKVPSTPALNDWINKTQGALKPAYTEVLEEARQQLELKWDEWNEEELKMNRVGGPICQLGYFCSPIRCSKVYQHLF